MHLLLKAPMEAVPGLSLGAGLGALRTGQGHSWKAGALGGPGGPWASGLRRGTRLRPEASEPGLGLDAPDPDGHHQILPTA